MRIRKRQLPFSLSPVTFTDPSLINRSPEAVQLHDATNERQHKKQPFLVEDGRGEVKEEGQKGNDTSNNDNNNTKKTMKMKTKTKKKCYDSNEGDDGEEVVVVRETKQKKVRGGAVMEGSRCSRVNGRGWRCCQPTLVGYSLCEHYLGKGRLRSMASVRNRSLVAAKNNNVQEMPISPSIKMKTKFDSKDNDDNEKKQLMITKKRMKLGMVKARSLSSLLGQTNVDLTIAENNK